MSVAIVQYNAGNVQSLLCALKRLGVDAVVSGEREVLEKATHVIFPGVGEASSAMKHLTKSGLASVIPSLENPVLGICLGLQLLCAASEEGSIECLGVFPEKVHRFSRGKKVPHVGWNSLSMITSPLFPKISEGSFVYYVHSYAAPQSDFTVATTEYGERFSAALARDNFFGVQFHPEKSGPVGEQILRNFLSI